MNRFFLLSIFALALTSGCGGKPVTSQEVLDSYTAQMQGTWQTPVGARAIWNGAEYAVTATITGDALSLKLTGASQVAQFNGKFTSTLDSNYDLLVKVTYTSMSLNTEPQPAKFETYLTGGAQRVCLTLANTAERPSSCVLPQQQQFRSVPNASTLDLTVELGDLGDPNSTLRTQRVALSRAL